VTRARFDQHALSLESGLPTSYSSKTHKKSTLLAGTTVVQAGDLDKPTLAYVNKTGGTTEKGREVRCLWRPLSTHTESPTTFLLLRLVRRSVRC
jgi:hypothetical protein